jgi:hypothetical protein
MEDVDVQLSCIRNPDQLLLHTPQSTGNATQNLGRLRVREQKNCAKAEPNLSVTALDAGLGAASGADVMEATRFKQDVAKARALVLESCTFLAFHILNTREFD